MKKLLIVLGITAITATSCNNKKPDDTKVLSASQQEYADFVKWKEEKAAKEAAEKTKTVVVEKPVVVQKTVAAAPAPAPARKKGWSKAAKGAAIGAGSGAVAGAIINKRNRGAGAVVGGVLGAGVGYGIGRSQDKKDGRY